MPASKRGCDIPGVIQDVTSAGDGRFSGFKDRVSSLLSLTSLVAKVSRLSLHHEVWFDGDPDRISDGLVSVAGGSSGVIRVFPSPTKTLLGTETIITSGTNSSIVPAGPIQTTAGELFWP